jgi:hypothetical protein
MKAKELHRVLSVVDANVEIAFREFDTDKGESLLIVDEWEPMLVYSPTNGTRMVIVLSGDSELLHRADKPKES